MSIQYIESIYSRYVKEYYGTKDILRDKDALLRMTT